MVKAFDCVIIPSLLFGLHGQHNRDAEKQYLYSK